MKGLIIAKRAPYTYLLLLLATGLLLALPATATAQDPPGRVGRLNFIQGSVSFQPAGTQDWLDANPNRPLTTGDNLWCADGRVELHIGSTSVRLSSQTGISFLNLNDQAVQVQLAQGTLNVRLRQLGESEAYEIDTPNLAFSLLRPGEYRVSVDPNGNSTVTTVWTGTGEVTGGGSAYNLEAGQQGAFSGSTPLTSNVVSAPGYDDFDNWCLSRDRREDQSRSSRYISREVIGYDDLDSYGTWRSDPVYGNVWVPSGVAVGWAPYHYGHWVYIAPWGWTWVEDEPWGFAPFHYGRWAYAGGGWAWVPGSVAVVAGGGYVMPMYAPAVVAFVGGGGFSVSIALGGGIAGVAWFALGPRDVWVPSYHASPAYVQNVNISNSTVINRTQITNVYNSTTINNVTNVSNITYMNQSAPGAVTAVPTEAFASGKPVAAIAVKVAPQQIQHPQVVQRVAVAPTPRSVVGPAPVAKVRPPATLANRPIVTKMKPSPQVVPIGSTQAIARSNLVKTAPSATPVMKPPAPANKPAVATAPGKPATPPAAAPASKPPAPAMKAATPPAAPPASKPPAPAMKAATPPAAAPASKPPAPAMKAPTPPAAAPASKPPAPATKPTTPPPAPEKKPVAPPPSKEVKPSPQPAPKPAAPAAAKPATKPEKPPEKPEKPEKPEPPQGN